VNDGPHLLSQRWRNGGRRIEFKAILDYRVPGYPKLHSVTLSQKNKTNKKLPKKWKKEEQSYLPNYKNFLEKIKYLG
jgi:hypothetical protein